MISKNADVSSAAALYQDIGRDAEKVANYHS